MAKRKRVHHLSYRLYPGQDDDLIAWLEGLNTLPYGAKSQEFRNTLRRGLAAEQEPASCERISAVPLDLGVLLPEVRRVVEAAVITALAQSGVSVTGSATTPDDETAALLRQLDESLLLEE